MNRYRFPAFLFLALCLWPGVLSAKGTQEKDFQEAQGKDNFSQKIDLTKLTPGQYNLLVRTKDAAGNISYVGPYNFYYDPTSDNPLMTVANPAPGTRVGASQNIVGVASAPKGVALVEVSVDGGPWAAAKGKAFWTYFFNAAGLPDGLHQFSVRGTDINAVVGPVVTVPFYLDQNLPAFSLSSQKSGDRVSGTVTLAGTLADGNGLKTLDLSTDDRKTSIPLGLSGDERAVSRSFSTSLDTRKFPDGPLVIWFHGVDGQGSEVRQAVLLFVDNTLPQISVLSPPPNQGLHGRVRFVVQAEKTLGLQSLTARVGDQGKPVSMAVVPGNPFHVVDLDLPPKGSGTVPVVFEAVDTAGKVGRITYVAKLNGDTDLPLVLLTTPLDKTVKAPLRLTGTLQATDGPGAVLWSLNGAPAVKQAVGLSFDFPLPGLVSGPNKLLLTPVDANDRLGKPLPLAFTAVLAPPTVSWGTLVQGDQEAPFTAGLVVSPEKKVKIVGTLGWPNPSKSVTWALGDTKPIPALVTGTGPAGSFTLNLPVDPPFGIVPVTVTATDAFDQTTTIKSWIDIANLAKPQGPEGTVFADQRVGSSSLVITPETPLRGFFSGGKIKSADLLLAKGTVAASVLQVTHDDKSVTIQDLKDGQFEGVKLRVVSDKGRVYDTDLGTLIGDTAPPVITLSSPLSGSWVKENLRIDGKVSDTSGLTKLEWSIDDGKNWQQLDPPSGQGGPFTRNFTLPGPDNVVNLLIRATDTAGRTGTVLTVVRRDTQAPEVDFTLPTLAPGATGQVYAVGRLRDEGALKSAEVTINKKTTQLPLDKPFTLTLDAEALAGNPVFFKVVDWAGNALEQNFTLPAAPTEAAPAAAKPEVQILFPKADTKGLNGVVPVVGRVVNFTTAPRLSVKGEATGDKSVDLTDAGYFTFEVNVSTLKNRTLAFSAVGDSKESASVTLALPYDPASELPQARFLPRADKAVLTGNVSASGWIGDSRGVVSWVWQLDNGEKHTETPDPAKPVGSFLVDLGIPEVGPHKLSVVPVNGAGKEGVPATTDWVSTTAPGPVEFKNLELGAILGVTKDSRLQGRIPSINPWRKTEIRFADLASPDPWNGPFVPLEVKKGPDGWNFDVPIPATLPFSRIGVVVRGEDTLGQKVEGRTLFHRVWAKDASLIVDTEGLVFVDEKLDASGRFNTVPGAPLTGTFRGRPIKTLALNPPMNALDAKVTDTQITVNAKDEGLYGPFTVVVTTVDNETFTAGPFTLFADQGGPALTWDVPTNADWIQNTVALSGKVSDPSGVASLEVSMDAGTSWQPLPLKSGAFDAKVAVPGADGLTGILLRATDKGGHTTIDTRVVTKDASAPAWSLVAPPQDRKVNGLTTIVGAATDLNPIASVEYSDDGKVFKLADGTSTFAFDLDFASYAKLPDKFLLRTTDTAGNQTVTPLVIPLDQDADKPVVQIQTPAEGEVVRSDFVLSGMAFDDDGVKTLSWRLDGGPWSRLEGVSSFQIPIPLAGLADNDHVVEVQAEDIYGTKGNVFRSGFKVSLAAPEAVMFTPEIEKTVSGIVGLVGASFDRNGVKGVQISLDNGLTWNKAELRAKEEILPSSPIDQAKAYLPNQRQEWEWRFDSTTLKDGTYLVMVRGSDTLGTIGLFTTLVNIDNSPPSLTLTKPSDGEQILDSLDLEGRSGDNIKMVSLRAELRAIDGPSVSGTRFAPVGNALIQTDLAVTPTFIRRWDLGTLSPGWYNLRLEAKDAAGNTTYVARNVRIEGVGADKVELLYPQAGESLAGSFLVEGRVTSRAKADKATVIIDGKTKIVVDVDDRGFFSQLLDGSVLGTGEHVVNAAVATSPSQTLTSESKKVLFDPLGPWVKVVSHRSGSYVTQRPFLSGTAGWTALALEASATAEEAQAHRQALEHHRVVLVEASLDNGKTFTAAQGTDSWKFRLESLGLPDGPLPLVFRARFQDGTTAIQRILVTVSQTPPSVELLTNVENGRFNGSIDLAGFSTGTGSVSAVEVAVRQGDKAGYQIPSFIQGMYLDGHLWGATVWDVGLGLTFFQDAVKLQAQVGQTPPGRFWGTVAGAKLIASIAQLPMGYFFGPDWSWLSSSLGVGANFSLFSMTQAPFDFASTPGVVLGGVVFQWEVAKATTGATFFKAYSWYNEATVWFISSDVQAEAKWVFSTGVRVGLF